MQQFPLSFEILQTITDDLEMRRNQTKVLIAEYAEWSKDPYAYIFYKGCIPKNIRIRVFKQYTERIEMLWPTEKGKWPHNPNSIL